MASQNRTLDIEKQQALLGAALEEISENGLEGASYNRIIERSGLSKGVVYYYFKNKESLYMTVLSEAKRQFLSSVGTLKLTGRLEDFWPACREYYGKALRFALSNMQIVKVARTLFGPGIDRTQNERIHDSFLELEKWMKMIVSRGQKLGALRVDMPFELLMNTVQSLGYTMDSWLFSRIEKDEDVDMEWFVGFAMDMYQRILSPEGAR